MDRKNITKLILYGFLFVSLATYIFLGLTLKWSIFFSYDMPRNALIFQDYLSHGTYLTSQSYYALASWLNIAWGPAYVFYYALLLKISSDPLTVSYILTILNVLGILSIVAAGWKYFSPVVGVIAGSLLAFNPYWFTYIRLIYQPSPLTLFLPIAVLLHFAATKSKQIAYVFLPIVWMVMFQIYIPAFAFIVTSIVFLIFYIKKQHFKYLLIGILISMIFVIPSISFFKENPDYIKPFFNAPKQFTPGETTIQERSQNVFLSFIQIPIGGMFRWQTGASYSDFINNYTVLYPQVSVFLSSVLIISLIWNLYIAIRYKDANRGVVVAWAISPLWYLLILWTSTLVPRYFLVAFPGVVLSIALFFYDIVKKLKEVTSVSFLVFALPIFIIFYWMALDVQYNLFIKNYTFPHGWFYDITETPYLYIKNATEWVIQDAKINSCNPILSDDLENPNFGLWMEVEYPWKYVYKRSVEVGDALQNCHYLIVHNDVATDLSIDHKYFGPFVAIRRD